MKVLKYDNQLTRLLCMKITYILNLNIIQKIKQVFFSFKTHCMSRDSNKLVVYKDRSSLIQ